MQNSVRFHAIEYDAGLSQEFEEKRNSSAPCRAINTYIASLLFLIIHMLHIKFCAISTNRKQDKLIPKILEKM